jgi:hypothetical protein
VPTSASMASRDRQGRGERSSSSTAASLATPERTVPWSGSVVAEGERTRSAPRRRMVRCATTAGSRRPGDRRTPDAVRAVSAQRSPSARSRTRSCRRRSRRAPRRPCRGLAPDDGRRDGLGVRDADRNPSPPSVPVVGSGVIEACLEETRGRLERRARAPGAGAFCRPRGGRLRNRQLFRARTGHDPADDSWPAASSRSRRRRSPGWPPPATDRRSPGDADARVSMLPARRVVANLHCEGLPRAGNGAS